MVAGGEPDLLFAGSIPDLYDRLLVPLIFDSYAVDLAGRIASEAPADVLEVAAGTGALTRQLAARTPATVAITATDLNQPMLDHAAIVGTARPVTWRQADAMHLPFADDSIDAVVCQFGVMFFPHRAAAFAEVRRVLRRGGVFMFNAWDRIEENDFALVVTESLGELFPLDPPTFLARIPHGYHDPDVIRADLAAGGFSSPAAIDAVDARSRATSPRTPAIAYCQGTPLRNEIVAHDPQRLEEATAHAASAIEQQYGSSEVDGRIRAHVVTVRAT